ncbi:MAG: 4Fe-4S binding protein [Gammaproteobacteria bacterium]
MTSARPFPVPVQVESLHARRRQQRPAAGIERVLVAARPWLPWVHGFMFVTFLGLLLAPVLLPASPFAAWLAGFSNWLIWGLWFPLVFVSVLVSGRSWCGVLCPMGAASQWMNRIGLKRPIPGWLRWEGTPIVTFVLITILGQTVGVRDYPGALLEVFGGTLLAALVIGFLYGRGRGRRAWCRHACPIGLLLGVFSRLSVVDLVPKHPRSGGDAYTERGLCPTMIDINRKTESRHCIMCMRCVHPGRRGGLALHLRAPGAEVGDIQRHHPVASELWFLLLGAGVALGGFLWLALPEYQWLRQQLGAWAIDHGFYWVGRHGPGWLMVEHPEAREAFVWLDFLLITGWMLAVMLGFTLVLGLLNAGAAWLSGRLGGTGRFRERFVTLGYQFAPVAMVSLLLGLGGELFGGLPAPWAVRIKLLLLAGAFVWGVGLGRRILRGQGLQGWPAALALVPGVAGAGMVVAAWWPALAGG